MPAEVARSMPSVQAPDTRSPEAESIAADDEMFSMLAAMYLQQFPPRMRAIGATSIRPRAG